MNSSVVERVWAWRTFVWAGVIGSLIAWAWAWLVGGGAFAVMILVAVASVVLALRGTQGMRLAIVGLMVAGLAMFLASLYWLAMLLLATRGQVTAMDVLTTAVFPMVAAIVLLLGSAGGYRHAKTSPTATPTTA
jgi:hypothetical protein